MIIDDIIETRILRRGFLKGLAGLIAAASSRAPSEAANIAADTLSLTQDTGARDRLLKFNQLLDQYGTTAVMQHFRNRYEFWYDHLTDQDWLDLANSLKLNIVD